MTNKEAKDLLNRYLKGECTPDEKSKVEAWYDMLPQGDMPGWEASGKMQIRDELKLAIDAQINNRRGRVINLKIMWAAASVILICSLGLVFMKYKDQLRERFSPVVYTETVVPAGERMKLVLSDSTVVVLNGSSRIRYPENFNGKIREVTLVEGEAFFDVKHDASKPFIVKARTTQINVLGTAFNVRAYKFLKNVQVTVTRGKVSVSSTGNAKHEKEPVVTLLPDDQATVAEADGNVVKKHIRAVDFTGWVQGRYRFDNETLGNVASALESYYKVHISFTSDNLKNIRFSSEFDSTDKLEDLLFDICKANNLSYTIKDQNVVFSAKK